MKLVTADNPLNADELAEAERLVTLAIVSQATADPSHEVVVIRADGVGVVARSKLPQREQEALPLRAEHQPAFVIVGDKMAPTWIALVRPDA